MSAAAIIWVLVAVLLAATGGFAWWLVGRPSELSMDRLESALPQEVGDWRGEGPPEIFDRESIFDYIDGHAEVYLAYGMHRCLARRYLGPEGEPDLVLDVFELGSPAEAFGAFTYDREGREAGVGNASRIRYGWLSFWQHRFFVSIVAEEESPVAEEAVLDLGRRVAALLPPGGEPPDLVGALPKAGRLEDSVRFLKHPQILATHLAVEASLFRLGNGAQAALAGYRRGGSAADLLIVRYPRSGAAREVRGAFRGRFLDDSGDGPAQGEDGSWFGVRVVNGTLVAVLGGSDGDLVSALLAEALGELEKR